MKMGFKIDMKKFKADFLAYEKKISIESGEILKVSAGAFVKRAIEYTPPFGKKIEKDLYTRAISYIPAEIEKPRNKYQHQDTNALRKGFLFRILKKEGRKFIPVYFKTNKAKTKREAKIKNRGLLKFSWGSNFEKYDMQVVPIVKSLSTKSKNLRNLEKYNQIIFKFKGSERSIEIINKSIEAQRNASFVGIAIKMGDTAARKSINYQCNKIQKAVKKI